MARILRGIKRTGRERRQAGHRRLSNQILVDAGPAKNREPGKMREPGKVPLLGRPWSLLSLEMAVVPQNVRRKALGRHRKMTAT